MSEEEHINEGDFDEEPSDDDDFKDFIRVKAQIGEQKQTNLAQPMRNFHNYINLNF